MQLAIRMLAVCVAILASTGIPTAVLADTTYWQYPTGRPGDWYTASNWTHGVPEDGDTAYVDNGGIAVFSTGRAAARSLYLGYSDSGTLRQDGGSLSLTGYGGVRIGYEAGAEGLFEMSGGRLQSQNDLVLGRHGSGTVVHTAGTADVVDTLYLGRYEGSTGVYRMSGAARVGAQAGRVGLEGTGTFIQEAGSVRVAESLELGYESGSSGEWTVADGTFRVTDLKIGRYRGEGRFIQTGGLCTVNGSLWLGERSGSDGTYRLEDGRLQAGEVVVGSTGTGRLTQTGGLLVADTLRVVATGALELHGGEVEVKAMWDATDAAVDFGGALLDVRLGTGAIANFASTNLRDAGGVAFTAGPGSLCMFPAGFDPYTAFGSFETEGDIYRPGSTLVVPEDSHIMLRGDMVDHVRCHGALTSVEGYPLNLLDGIELLGEGAADISGDLHVNDDVSCLASVGSLHAKRETIGGDADGRFLQTAGTHLVDGDLYLGRNEGVTGHFDLIGGTLEAGTIHVGYEGEGHFLQTGGQTSVGGLYAGDHTEAACSVTLEAGGLTANAIAIDDTATITIAGGALTVKDYGFALRGPCTLTGGAVTAKAAQVGSTFHHSGGTFDVEETLRLGAEFYSSGSYAGHYMLSGDAALRAGEAHLGWHGTTRFDQAGGTVNVPGALHVGYGTGLALYNLSAGEVSCGDLKVGESGIGRFDQAGGIVSAGYFLLGPGSTYRPRGGSLTAPGSALIQGTLDWAGGDGTVTLAGLVDAGRGRLRNAAAGTFHLGPQSLAVFPQGFDPASAFGTFINEGLWTTAGQPCVIPTGWTVVGRGCIEQPIECAGTLLGDGVGPLDLFGRLTVAGGEVNLGEGSARLAGPDNGISSGRLTCGYLDVGYHTRGTFTQTGGTVESASESDPLRLHIGHGEFGAGRYVLRGGDLDTAETTCGYKGYDDTAGTADFLQEGGTHRTGSLYVGTARDARAVYTLEAGTLHVNRCYVGDYGEGRLVLEGGAFTVDAAGHHGYGYGALTINWPGTAELRGGVLEVEELHDYGHLVHEGTTVNVEERVTVSDAGLYEMLAGGLSADRLYVVGDAEMVQRGGRVTTVRNVTIGSSDYYHNYGTAVYRLAGGELVAGDSMSVGPRYNDARLVLEDPAARLVVRDGLRFGDRGSLEAVRDAVIHLVDSNFRHTVTDPEALEDLEHIHLIFEGGLDRTPIFEVAGKDLGDGWAGYDLNFAVGELALGEDAPARLELVDSEDNQPDWSGTEALYVHELTVGRNSILDVNGLHLYYRVLHLAPGGSIVGQASSIPAIPEPATLVLLAAGAAAVLAARRRRRVPAAVLVLAVLASGATAGESHWQRDPATPGDWFDAANWTNGVPGHATNVYVDNGGTARLADGAARSDDLFIGYEHTGSLEHTGDAGGTWYTVYIGREPGSEGTYTLAGPADFRSNRHLFVGHYGTGTFTQAGGTSTVGDHLYVGYGDVGCGTLTLTDGAAVDVDDNFMLGYYGTGEAVQHSGVVVVDNEVILGYHTTGEGTYTLHGGTLHVREDVRLGSNGHAVFTQNGGTCTVDERMYLGQSSTADGSYNLAGGVLDVYDLHVGGEGTGRFRQTGGTTRVRSVRAGSDGRYDLSGGTLEVAEYAAFDGGLDFGGGPGAIVARTGAMVDLSRGPLLGTGAASFEAEAGTLTIVPSGFDPYAAFGHFAAEGPVHVRGTTLVVPEGQGFTGQGAIDDHVVCLGRINTHPNRSLDLNGGVEVGAPGVVDLGRDGVLTVDDTVSGITGGHLTMYDAYIGRTGQGTFTQTGGEVPFDRIMFIGYDPGAEGEYRMHGGTLGNGADSLQIGYRGTGRFLQDGGHVAPSGVVIAEVGPGSCGLYELTGDAVLSPRWLGVGREGTGEFIQDGGTVTVEDLTLGYEETAFGTYHMLAGDLAAEEVLIGRYGQGLFRHEGGRVSVENSVVLADLGYTDVGTGRYELSGSGELGAGSVFVGDERLGTFVQTGGTLTVDNVLYVGSYGGTGLYELGGGTLIAPEERVGMPYGDELPEGTVVQTGGANSAANLLIGEKGSYTMTGGDLSVDHYWLLEGDLDLDGAAVDLHVGDALVDFSRGTLTGTGAARLTAGPNALLLVAAGFDPYAAFASLTGGGVVHPVGSTLVIPSHVHVPAARGRIEDFVRCEGGLSAQPDQGLDLLRGAWVTTGSEMDLGEGKLHVDGDDSGIDGGRLVAGNVAVGYGGVGRFTQTGGRVELEGEFASLYLGEKRHARGTYVLAGGELHAYAVRAGWGYAAIGAVEHTGGRLVTEHLSLGRERNALGTYDLTGTGTLAVRCLSVGGGQEGGAGTHGVFRQSGGAVDVSALLAVGSAAAGLYELTAGRLTADDVDINQSGDGGPGVFVQQGGTHWVNHDLRLGAGLYEMEDGSLSTDLLWISSRAPAEGLFCQTGGTVSARTRFEMSPGGYDAGRYELHGGMLATGDTVLGIDGGAATLVQTGGQHGTGHLTLGPNSTYRMTGGSLAVGDSIDSAGHMDFGGTTATLTTNGIIDFGHGALTGTENLSLLVGYDSLVIFPAGFDPDTDLADFVHVGPVHYAGGTLELFPPHVTDRDVRGRGTIEDHVHVHSGWLGATTAIDLETGLYLGHSAHAHLGTGSLTVHNAVSGMDGGTLEAHRLTVGGEVPGTFTQNDGEVAVATSFMLEDAGTYVMNGGELTADEMELSGYPTPPEFVHTGGEVRVAGTLDLGHCDTRPGSYALSGGFLTAADAYVRGQFAFVQTGGTHEADGLSVEGSYRLDEGLLSVRRETVYSGASGFTQTGGTHTVAESFLLRSGHYDLEGGRFSALEEHIGYQNTSYAGTFNQTGGRNDAGHLTTVRAGTLRISGGSLHVSDSIDNAATIDMAGGTGAIVAWGLVNLGRGEFLNAEAASLFVGPDSLVIFPAGFDPDTDLGVFSCAGLVDFAGGTIEVPAGAGFSGRGTIDDHVHAVGTIRATTAIHLSENVTVDGGDVDLGDGTLSAMEHDGAVTAGRLEARQINLTAWIGGRPRIDQTGGAVVVHEGLAMNGGCYSLADAGSLEVETVELKGYSTFAQTGGHVAVGTEFLVSNYNVANPSTLSGGVLDARDGTVKVTGRGQGMLRLRDDALVIADTLTVYGQNEPLDAAGGTLRINAMETSQWPVRTIGGNLQFGHLGGGQSALFEMEAGEVLSVGRDLVVGYEAPAEVIVRGGRLMAEDLRVGHLAGAPGYLEVERASLTAGTLHLGSAEAMGLLALTDPEAVVEVREAWIVGPRGRLTAVDGVAVHMTGAVFENLSSDGQALEDLERVGFIFEGGPAADDTLEVAGMDRGDGPQGFDANFAMGSLVLGGDDVACLRLVDAVDNGNRGGPGGHDEALYVHDLVVGPGCTLDLNGLHLYYDGTFGHEGGAIVNGWPLPEPATLALLAAGAAVMWLKRRRKA